MMLNSALTWGGGIAKHTGLICAGFAGGLLLLTMAFNFASTSIRNNQIDCALAELLIMDEATMNQLEQSSLWKSEANQILAHRLEAFDQTLTMLGNRPNLIQTKAIDAEEAAAEITSYHNKILWEIEDAHLIETKLTEAHERGIAVLEKLLQFGLGAKDNLNELEAVVMEHLPAGDADKLKSRFESLFSSVEKLTSRLRKHQEGSNPITAKEYRQILASVDYNIQRMSSFIKRVEVAVGEKNTPLTHADFLKLMHGMDKDEKVVDSEMSKYPFKTFRDDAADVADALHRQSSGEYSSLGNGFQNGVVRRSWRKHWERELVKLLPKDGSASNRLHELPKKCVHGDRNRLVLISMLVVATLIQAACWHRMLKFLISGNLRSVHELFL